jgi:deazaflavin-dependent oxidoreductase (nitroreductase family)
VPPPWFVHAFWKGHRALHRLSHGRFLWTPASTRGWGALRLTTIGRRSGRERVVIVGYLEDGPNLVVLAMNGWDEGHPAWWLNLEAHPEATVRLKGQAPRPVRARAAKGEERHRLWDRWAAVDHDLDGYAARRSTMTPVVVLEPVAGARGPDEGSKVPDPDRLAPRPAPRLRRLRRGGRPARPAARERRRPAAGAASGRRDLGRQRRPPRPAVVRARACWSPEPDPHPARSACPALVGRRGRVMMAGGGVGGGVRG